MAFLWILGGFVLLLALMALAEAVLPDDPDYSGDVGDGN